MPVYHFIEYSEAYSKTLGCLWQYYRDEPTLENNGNTIDFPGHNNNSASFKFKRKITGQTVNDGTKDVEIIVPLKYPSNFWRIVDMPLISPIQDGEADGVGKKVPPTRFSSVTSANVRVSSRNILTFSFNPFSTLV